MKVVSRSMNNGHNPLCSRSFCTCNFRRWAQTIGHESSRGSSPVPNQMSNSHTCQPNTNRIVDLLGSSNGVDNRVETRAILSFILIKELGSEFEGSDKLVVMANSAPSFADSIYSEILKIPSEQRKGIKNLTDQVSLDPRSYQHDITKVFKEFVSHTQYEAGKPTFGMLLCLIVYLVELCRRFLENDRGYEIPSIHNTATRLMLDAEHQLSPANWAEYLENHPPRERTDRPHTLERRPSAAANAAAMIFSMVEAYSKYTKWR